LDFLLVLAGISANQRILGKLTVNRSPVVVDQEKVIDSMIISAS